MTHPEFRLKLAAVGFGVFIPVFFVASGVRFDLDALFGSRPRRSPRSQRSSPRCSSPAGCRRCSTAASSSAAGSIAAALLQATSLPFIVAATQIGQDLGRDRRRHLGGLHRRRAGDGARLPDQRRSAFCEAAADELRQAREPPVDLA